MACPEVGYLDKHLIGQKYVLGLYVTVEDAMVVNMVEPFCYLMDQGYLLVEAHFARD